MRSQPWRTAPVVFLSVNQAWAHILHGTIRRCEQRRRLYKGILPSEVEALANLMATENPIPLLVFYFVLTHTVLVIALAVRPSLRWRFFAWLGIAYVCLRATKADAGESFVNYQTGSAFGTVCFNALHVLVIADPVEEWRHELQDAPLWKVPFWRRVYWVLCAVWNSRGIGWNYQAANIPPFPKLSRKAFVLNRYLRILWHAFLVDLCQSYMDINPLFSLSGPQAQSLRSQGVVLNVLNILAMFTPAYCMISISYDLLSIFAVALGVTEPKTWPLIFGEWKEAYTVRRFWSRTWHQNMRRFVSGTGKAVARAIGCTPGTWLSARIQLLVGFSISGFAHVLGDAMVGRRFAGCSLPFFLLQACGITLEDFAIACAKRAGIRAGLYTRSVGYVWTAVWFYWSAPLFADWGLKAGMGMHRTFGWSVARPLLGSLVEGALLERIKGGSAQVNHTIVHEVL